jgi:ABC-type nitrate/sulfonate/bicarbonate transport system permease component
MTVAFADRPARGRVKRPGPAPVIGQRVKVLGIQTACVAVLLAAWQLAVVSGAVPESEVTQPTAVAHRLWDMLATQEFWSAVGETAHTWVIGLLVSLVVAVPLGLLLGASTLLYRMFRVTIDFLRTIPPVVLLPLALLLYGAREQTALLLVAFGSVWPLLLQTMYGVHQVDPVSRDVARAYQLRRLDFVRSVLLPSAAPFVATGVRIAATMSLLLVVGSELLGGIPGIGAQIAVDQTSAAQIPSMYAYVVVATALGVAVNLLIVRLERRVLSWHSAHKSQQEA